MATQTKGPRIKPSGGMELMAWYFMRISGLVLVIMAVTHYAIMHVINDIHAVNYNFVVTRYRTPFWRTYDLIMLTLALIHGMNGIRYVIDDYIHTPSRRVIALSILYIICFALLILGSLVILTFAPVSAVSS